MVKKGQLTYDNSVKTKRLRKWLLFGTAAVLAGCGGGGLLGFWMLSLPKVESLEYYKPDIVTQIFDMKGLPVAQFYTERRIPLSRDEIPDLMVNAILAAEDSDFFKHPGFDFTGILRALLVDIKTGRMSQGASTITQQLARLLFLSQEKTFSRKLKEALLAVKIEQRYSKDDILVLYMNQCYFGHGAYGVESAARTFFDTSVVELSPAQCALLASLLKNPSFYSPFRHPDRAVSSRDRVLKRMLENGFISEDLYNAAVNESLDVVSGNETGNIAPYFIEEIRKHLVQTMGNERILTGGLRIYSTLDTHHQEAAEIAIREGLDEFIARHPDAESPQVALVSIRPVTGEITSMIGGDNFNTTKFNRAVQAKRQSGSTIKPFVYLTALRKGYAPNYVIMDNPVVFKDPQTNREYRPKNYDLKYHGPTTLRVGLEKSYNVITAKLVDELGIQSCIDTMHLAGIQGDLPPYLSVGLGSGEVTLIEMVNAYATIAASGLRTEPIMIREIRDSDNTLLQSFQPKVEEVFGASECFQITSILQGAVNSGSGWRARRLNRSIAAKTGTTDNFTDAWFIGYTPSLVAGVWVGYDLPKSLGAGESGSRAAGPIFTRFMEQVLAGTPQESFTKPEELEKIRICHETGLLLNESCPDQIDEYFLRKNVPVVVCPIHQ